METNESENKKFRVLIAPTPITQIQGYDTTEIHEKFERLIIRLCKIFENYNNVEVIFKIHPSQSGHNNEIKKIIQKYSKRIPIYMLNPNAELTPTIGYAVPTLKASGVPYISILESDKTT